MRAKRFAIGSAAVFGAIGAAVWLSSSSGAAGTPIRGGSSAERALIATEISLAAPRVITGVTLRGATPAEARPGVSASDDAWMELFASASGPAAAVSATFQAQLVGLAYADDGQADGVSSHLGGMSVDVDAPTGKPLDRVALYTPGANAPNVNVGDIGATTVALSEKIHQGAAHIAGAQIKSLTFYHLPRLAVAVTIQVPDGGSFVRQAAENTFALFGSDHGYDGRLLRVVNPAGNIVFASSYVVRLQSGEVWAAPGLDGDFHQ